MNTETAPRHDVTPAAGYAGDVSPDTAWRMLGEQANAVLVDVRTVAEWSYVGVPDLATLGKQVVLVEWQSFPAMTMDPGFVVKTGQAVGGSKGPLLFICRSGARSAAAARAMTNAGFGPCFNVADGFEGPLDGERRRGGTRGWKASGLPWFQT
jgi:rhodanese-related sulfurtransferase